MYAPVETHRNELTLIIDSQVTRVASYTEEPVRFSVVSLYGEIENEVRKVA